MFHAKILIIPENDTIFAKKTDKLVLIFSVISFLLLYGIRISLHLNISFILFIKLLLLNHPTSEGDYLLQGQGAASYPLPFE